MARLKEQVTKCSETDKIKNNKEFYNNTQRVLEKLESYKNAEADQNMMLTILRVQQLVGEINNDASSN